MGIVYFDICSIPLFLIILFVCYSRRMIKGNANQLFILLVAMSLFSALADLGIEISNNAAPLSEGGQLLCSASTYLYLVVRNATNAVLLLFLLALTHTTFLMRRRWARIVFSLPYMCILIMLLQNPFTHNAFTVSAQGYDRGPLMTAFYIIALIYGLAGLAYCIYCRRYFSAKKWAALLSVYVLGHLAVVIQFFWPGLLLEMFCTAVGELLIMLSIMRPEERMDAEVGMLSWASYQSDLSNILRSGEQVQITVIRIINCREVRNFLGDHEYNLYLAAVSDSIRGIRWNHPRRVEIYYERPGTVYLITDQDEPAAEEVADRLASRAGDRLRRYEKMGFRFDSRVCVIRCPEDLRDAEDIISLGHRFLQIDTRRQTVFRAAEIVGSSTFAVEAHIGEILERAIREDRVEVYYQPIYDLNAGKFRSAEALARIRDPEYGLISPAVFIPAAEAMGYIIPIGDKVLDRVFRFASPQGPAAPGLDYTEVNLSVAQCMESSLPEKIRALQQTYGTDPDRINLEITETTFESIGEIMMENVEELIRMGYSFALDDYGIGYSSIQRVNHIPLKLVKIDKSMVDEISSENGRKILLHTVQMMQSIGKKLVAEGVETREVAGILKEMHCDYIQGFYFSRPMPEEEFVRFMEQQNGAGVD